MPDKRIIIGSSRWTGYEPLLLAEDLGIFENNLGNTQIIKFNNEEEVIRNIREHKIHAATLTLDMLIILNQMGFPCNAVLVIDYSMGGDMIIGNKDIYSINDLKGKTIGLEKLYINEYFLARALAENNIKTNDIKLKFITIDKQLESLEKKQVDAIVTYNPYAAVLFQKGYNVIFTSKDIPSSIIDLLIFPNEFYQDNKKEVKKIIQSWFDTLNFINSNYHKAMKMMAKNEGVDEYEFKVAFDEILIPNLEENIAFFDLESKKNIFKISDITLDFMLKKKMIKNKIDTSKIFNSELLKKIQSI